MHLVSRSVEATRSDGPAFAFEAGICPCRGGVRIFMHGLTVIIPRRGTGDKKSPASMLLAGLLSEKYAREPGRRPSPAGWSRLAAKSAPPRPTVFYAIAFVVHLSLR